MAPALTQATPHQRCCPPNSTTTPSLTLIPSAKHSPSSLIDSRGVDHHQVWPSRCCGSSATSGPVKTDTRRPAKCRKNSSVVIGKEIARSEELTKSRGGQGGGVADGQGALDPPPTIVKAVAAPGPPPTIGQGTDLANTITSAAAVAPRSSAPNNGGGGGRGASPSSLNGNATTIMGLHPTAPGDRMDLDSPPLVVQTLGKTANHTVGWTSADTVPDVAEEEATVDDILDVIKSMEVGDQCGDIGLTIAEQQLLREAAAAVMDDATAAALPVSEPALLVIEDKEAEVERRLTEARSKQQQIEARCQTLLRRAGRLQSRHVGRHVADQVAHFVAYAKETLSIGAKGRSGHHGVGGSNLYGWAEDGRLPTREEVRNIPTATLVNLVSRLQAPPVSYLSNRRYFGLPNRSTPAGHQQPNGGNNINRTTRQLSANMAETLEEVAGLWEAQLRYLQRHDDPDATESSSGGESDDEPPPVASTAAETPILSSSSMAGEHTTGLDASSLPGSATSTPATVPPAPKPVST